MIESSIQQQGINLKQQLTTTSNTKVQQQKRVQKTIGIINKQLEQTTRKTIKQQLTVPTSTTLY